MAGISRADLPTPALLLDLAALEANIAAMAAWTRDHQVAIRPHAKVHKSPQIARRQLAAGAVGLTAATVYEAHAMLAAGPAEILIANEVVDPGHLRLLPGIARQAALMVAVDDGRNARQLSQAATAAGVQFGVLIDVDVGMGRCGTRTIPAAVALARQVAGLPGLALRGVMGYEGHVVLEPDPQVRAARAAAAMDHLAQVADAIRAAGHQVAIVSAGGTNTHDMTGLHPAVTELQAGTYAVMDAGYAPLAARFSPVLSVAARVVSHQGGTAVLNCGTKSIATEVCPPSVPAAIGTVREVHEEHMLIDAAGGWAPEPGELVEVAVGYAGGTINLHDGYYVLDGGVVVDTWPIVARGSGRVPGLPADDRARA
jgi:D-threonine aldolase